MSDKSSNPLLRERRFQAISCDTKSGIGLKALRNRQHTTLKSAIKGNLPFMVFSRTKSNVTAKLFLIAIQNSIAIFSLAFMPRNGFHSATLIKYTFLLNELLSNVKLSNKCLIIAV